MEGFNAWMEEHFVPIAAKIGSQKHLVAVRDAFIATMPVTMAGSVATLLNVFLRDLPTEAKMDGFVKAMQPVIGVNGNVWWGSLAIIALVLSFTIGYTLSKAYDVDPLAGGLISFASFITVTPQGVTVALEKGAQVGNIVLEEAASIGTWGNIGWGFTNSGGLFTALVIGFISTIIYAKLVQKKVTIKLPDSVPPAVSKAFVAIIPGVIAMYVCGILAYLCGNAFGMSIGELILEYVQKPFLALSQNFGTVLITVIAVQLFWFFGIHGTNVLAPVLEGVYKVALDANNVAFNSKQPLEYLWTRPSFDAYVWMGGAGCTLALIIAIFIFSKRAESKQVAALSAPMGVFNINEPIVFGMPIVLNPIYFIPWILVPVVLTCTAYAATAAGLVPPAVVGPSWVIPPVIFAYLAAGASIPAALLAAINLAIAVAIWSVFVMLANRMDAKEE